MFFCFTLRRTGNLWFAIGWHAAFDFGETYVYSVPDSGFVMPGHLLAASLHGPRWLTGGTVGPEGSVVDFVVLVPFSRFSIESTVSAFTPTKSTLASKAYLAPSDSGSAEADSLLRPTQH